MKIFTINPMHITNDETTSKLYSIMQFGLLPENIIKIINVIITNQNFNKKIYKPNSIFLKC